MHPARLSFLAVKHAVTRKVLSCDAQPDGTTFALECGHTFLMPPHFDYRFVTTRRCTPCGEALVPTMPEYAREFEPKA